jgi:HopA1 effector protein family/Lanthionine synthetase C-like protein
MTELHPDLLSVLDAVVIHSRARFAVRDQIHELPAPMPDDLLFDKVAAQECAIVSALEDAIYRYLYIQPAGPYLESAGDELARRERVAALSSANSGRGSWNGGWVVRETDRDGQVVVSRGDLTVWATANQVRTADGEFRAGQTCRLWAGKEQRNRVRGFYFAFGDAEDECDQDASEPLLRYYWHLSSEAAVPFVAAATELLNATGAPFSLKVFTDPTAYRRADAGLIFVRRQHHRLFGDAIARIHATIAPWLRESVPLFTKFLGRGLAAAAGPSGRVSFGQHRCGLAATALWRSFLRQEHDLAARAATIADIYKEAGLDPRFPYLEPGCVDEFEPLVAPGVEAEVAIPFKTGMRSSDLTISNEAVLGTISPREAAIRIGESLCRNAVWDVTGRYCNWMGRVSPRNAATNSPAGVTAAALGQDLHVGSAGIALFLAQLHAATGNDEFKRTAEGAMARSRLQLAVPRAAARRSAATSLGSAREVAMLRLHTLTQDHGLNDGHVAAARAAISVVLDAIDAHIAAPRFDATIRDGLAGLGDVLFNTGVVLEDRSYQDRARALAQTLIDRYSARDNWPTGSPGGGPNPSLLLGTAGIGYWFLRLDDPEHVPGPLLVDPMEGDEPE